jgi:lipopolysaccharide export system protein LptA
MIKNERLFAFYTYTSTLVRAGFLIILFIAIGLMAKAQAGQADTSAKTQVIILHADRLNMQKINDTTQLTSLGGNAAVKQDSTLFFADSIVLNKSKNILEAFGKVHINDRDSIHIYSDYLKYLSKEKKAHLKGSVKLTDGKSALTTPDLDYDVNTKIGIYTNGGKVVTKTSVLTSKEAFYYGETRDIYFKKKVLMVDSGYTVKTDTLLYNTNTDIATFTVPTVITSGSRKVYTTDGTYDMQQKQAHFNKRPEIHDSTTVLIADEVASDSAGFGEARGNVVYRDTAQGITLFSNNLKTNRNEGSFLATLKPVMILKQDLDSIFIAADTLYSAKLTDIRKYRKIPVIIDSMPVKDSAALERDSSNRFFEAYYHVRIFTDSLQAVGDSLFYSAEDSVFRLFKQPILWAKESQITGDTIYLYSKNKKPARMYVFENALALNKTDSLYYNQLKGRTINGYFKNGEIDYMHAKGNAESVYYGQDERNKFISVNKAKADIIDMYFDNKKPRKVVLRSSVEGTAYPMRQVNHEDLRLRGFKWLDALRPKSKYAFIPADSLPKAKLPAVVTPEKKPAEKEVKPAATKKDVLKKQPASPAKL